MAVKAPEKGKAKAWKEPKLQNTAPAPKKPRAHPPYSKMINEAIMALKERTGSSQIAIAKFIQGKQNPNLPANFKKLLLIQLKKLVASGKLVKVKNSFKLPPKTTNVKAPVKAKEKTEAPAKLRGTTVKLKAVTEAKTKKSLKTAAAKSAGKKAPKSPRKKGSVSAKKKTPMKEMKKPKSIKSPVKKATVKKAKK